LTQIAPNVSNTNALKINFVHSTQIILCVLFSRGIPFARLSVCVRVCVFFFFGATTTKACALRVVLARVIQTYYCYVGTPSVATWPEMSQLPDYKDNFPVYPGVSLKKVVRKLDPAGVDLLQRMLEYDPTKRISAESALHHPYFRDLNTQRRPRPKK